MSNIDKTCIICYDDDGHNKLCKKCIYMYCNKCAYIINYNCCICYRIVKKKQEFPIMVFDMFDNDEFLNNIEINTGLWIFIGIYHLIKKVCVLFLMVLFSLPIILFISQIFA